MTKGETTGPGPGDRWKLLLAIAGLVLLTFAVHWPALHAGYIWDDDDHLTANPAMTASDGLRQIWSSLAVSRYYPLTLTTFWCEHRLWGLRPMPYHLVNIALHALSAVLLFLLLKDWRVPGAFAAAAIWSVHPVTVESVAWVTEMKNTQSGVFFFLSLLCYAAYWRRTRTGMYWLSLLFFAAALASKPSTVTLPVVLLLVAWWRGGRVTHGDVGRTLPFFGLAAVMSLMTVAEQQRHIEGIGHAWTLTVAERLQLAGRNLWFYAGKIVWPRDLMFVYPRWHVAGTGWGPLAGALLVAAGLWIMRRNAWARACLAGLGCYVALLLPVLGLIDVYYFRFSFVADHFQYLASAALIVLLAAGMAQVVRARGAQVALAVAAVAACASISWTYGPVFHDEETVWRDTLAKNPGSFMPQNNLGGLLFASGRYEEAAEHLQIAARLQPRIWQVQLALANTLAKLGDLDGAAARYRVALALRPRLSEAHYNLGVVQTDLGQRDEAVDDFRDAIAIRPGFADAYRKLAVLLMDRGDDAESVRTLRLGLLANPADPGLARELAWLLATSPDPASRDGFAAVQLAETISRQTGNRQPDSLDTLAAAYAEAGCFDDAVVTARRALALARDSGLTDLAAQISSRLALYERHEPYHGEPR